MFIEINKTNSYNEKGTALIRAEDIIGIKENHVEPTKLYDDQGNLVSETPATTKDYSLLVASEIARETYHIDETEYKRLVALLTATK